MMKYTAAPVRPIYVIKAAQETVNNSVTLQNDDELVSPTLPANTVWEMELVIHCTSSTVADFKSAITLPAGATLNAALIYDSTSLVTFLLTDTGASRATGGAAASISLIYRGILRIAATAGTAQLQWAQNTAEVSNTTVNVDSYMKLSRIS